MDNRSQDNFKVLVVGKDPDPEIVGGCDSYKASVAVLLSKLGIDAIETTDITNIVEHGKSSSLLDARRWISRNSLRGFEGQKVKVICALDARSSYDEAWVDVMCLIFGKHSNKEKFPFVAAVMQNKDMLKSNKHLKKFFPSLENAIVPETSNENCEDKSEMDLSFDTYMSVHFSGRGKTFERESSNDKLPLLEHNVNIVLETMDDASAQHLKRIIGDLEPFEIRTLPLGQDGRKDVKAWSSEKVILFGKTGSGKSTVAQMLTQGCLDAVHYSATPTSESGSSDCGSSSRHMSSPASSSPPMDLPSGKFATSSNARGMTSKIERGEGRGWHVTDTPGWGEPRGGTVSTAVAKEILNFVIDACGIYSHFVYVFNYGRAMTLEDNLWQFFKETLFVGAEENFSVVVTCFDEGLHAACKEEVESKFEGCKNFIYVDFLPVNHRGNAEEEKEDKDVRAVSLQKLEHGLSTLGVADRVCWEGKYSRENHRFIKSDFKAKVKGSLSICDSVDTIIANSLNYLLIRPKNTIAGLFRKSKIEQNFLLLPQ